MNNEAIVGIIKNDKGLLIASYSYKGQEYELLTRDLEEAKSFLYCHWERKMAIKGRFGEDVKIVKDTGNGWHIVEDNEGNLFEWNERDLTICNQLEG